MGHKPRCQHVPCLFPIFRREVMRSVWILDVAQPFRSLSIVRHKAMVQRSCKFREHIGITASHLREQSRRKEAVKMEMGTLRPGKPPLWRSDNRSCYLYALVGNKGGIGDKPSKGMTRNPNPLSVCPPALNEGIKNQWDFLNCRTNGRKECCFELHIPDEVWRDRRQKRMEIPIAPPSIAHFRNAHAKQHSFRQQPLH